MVDVELVHDCGIGLASGEHKTYSTFEERVMWQGTAYCYEGECPACGGELDPEEDRVFVSGH